MLAMFVCQCLRCGVRWQDDGDYDFVPLFCIHLFGMEPNIVFQKQIDADCVKEMTGRVLGLVGEKFDLASLLKWI